MTGGPSARAPRGAKRRRLGVGAWLALSLAVSLVGCGGSEDAAAPSLVISSNVAGTAASIVSQRRQEVAAELRELRTRLAEVEERLRAAQDVAVRRDIVAPEDGAILNLRLFNIGAVVRPGDPVMDLVPDEPRVFPVGRLDYETEGLLLLTNDGALTHRLTHPSFGVEKEV